MEQDFAAQQEQAAQQAAAAAAAAAAAQGLPPELQQQAAEQAAAAQQAAAQQAMQAAEAAIAAGVPLNAAAAAGAAGAFGQPFDAAAAAAALQQQATIVQQQAAVVVELQQKVQALEMCYKAANTFSKLVPKPEPFDGKDSAKVGSWIWCLEHYFSVFNILDDWSRIQLAVTYLIGPARDWWRSLDEAVACPTIWDDFKTQLVATFQSIDPVERARNTLATLHQVTTVRQYAAAFRNITLLIPGLTDADKKDRFLRGLRPDIQKETRLKDPASFDKAVEMASRIEGVNKTVERSITNRPNRYNGNNASTASSSGASFRNGGSNGPTRMELGAASAVDQRNFNRQRNSNQQRRPRLTEEMRQRLIKEGRCFFCRRTGHMAIECPEKKELGM